MNNARHQPRRLCLAWLDIRNAFGSVRHSALLTTLTHMGFPPDLISMIGNVYTGATTEVVTPLGKTPAIPIHSGIKQGCPLSAILFNLAVKLIIRKCVAKAETLLRGPLKHHGCPISILAYANDLVILARNSQDLQTLLDAVSSAANCLSLQFRPDKCASLSMARIAPRIEINQFRVQTQHIPALQREDHYRYLGVPIGLVPNISNLQNLGDELTTKLDKIEQSLLALWQKLDAIRTFIQPCLTYAFRSDSQIPPILPLPTDKDDQINQLSPTSCNTTLHICIQTSWWPCLYRPYPRKPCPDHRPSPEDPKF